MNSPFLRLMWKDLRSQRSLWLAAVVFYVVVAGIFAANLLLQSTVVPLIRFVAASAWITSVMTVLFVVGSLAQPWAGEEDDGTAVWLRMLPVSTTTLLTSRLCTTLLAGLALILACSLLSAVSLLWIDVSTDTAVHRVPADTSTAASAAHIVSVLTGLVACLLASLTARSLFSFLGRSVVLCLCVMLTLIYAQETRQWFWPLLLLPAMGGLVPVAVRRWHRGLTGAGHLRRRIPQPLTTMLESQSIWKEQWDRFWLRRLKSAATQGTAAGRLRATLLWMELRNVAAWLVLSAGLVMVVLTIFDGAIRPGGGMMLLAVAGLVIEAGLRTWRYDQHRQTGLFRTHRGAPAGLVWGIRNLVWLSGILLMLCATVTLELLFQWILGREQPFGFYGALHEAMTNSSSTWMLYSVPGWSRLYVIAAATGWLFSTAQLSAVWLRSPFLAALCAFAATLVGFPWLTYLMAYGFPLWLFFWPLLLLFVVLVPLTADQWQYFRSSSRITACRVLSLTLIGTAAGIGSQLWWAWEIPQIHPESAAWARQLRRDVDHTFLKQTEELPTTTSWYLFEAARPDAAIPVGTANTPNADDRPGLQGMARQVGENFDQSLAAIEDIVARLTSNDPCLPPTWRVPWKTHQRPALDSVDVLLYDAGQLFSQGKHQAATDRCLQGVELSCFLASQATSWLQYWNCLSRHALALQALRRVAADPTWSGMQLSELRQKFQKTVLKRQFICRVPQNCFAMYRDVLNDSTFLTQQLEEQGLYPTQTDSPINQIRHSWAGRQRFLRLCGQYLRYATLHHESQPENFPPKQQLQRWCQQDPKTSTQLDAAPIMISGDDGISWPAMMFQETVNQQRATLLVLAAYEYRHIHGQLPQTLVQLTQLDVPVDLQWLNRAREGKLSYFPHGPGHGVGKIGDSGTAEFLSADQPMMHLGWWDSAALNHLTDKDRQQIVTRPTDPTMIRVVSQQDWFSPVASAGNSEGLPESQNAEPLWPVTPQEHSDHDSAAP